MAPHNLNLALFVQQKYSWFIDLNKELLKNFFLILICFIYVLHH